MMIGRSLPATPPVWASTVRFRNDGAAAKLASATLDDLRKSLRDTGMISSPLRSAGLVQSSGFSLHDSMITSLHKGANPELWTLNSGPELFLSSLKLRRAQYQTKYSGGLEVFAGHCYLRTQVGTHAKSAFHLFRVADALLPFADSLIRG